MENEFRITRIIKAPIQKVFEALSNPQIISEYAGETVLEPKLGGKFSMFDGWVNGKVLAYQPNSLLSYTWKPNDWDADADESIVSYKLIADKENTIIELTHTNLPDETEATNHEKGWEEYVFQPLEEFLEMG
ncbi:MAG: SRPBCC domain-containing protein [Bacteroidota bacterium]|nr:SRPBCC domain-containing protein [Bacteroidota bacterium]